jgi:hypothetical protein
LVFALLLFFFALNQKENVRQRGEDVKHSCESAFSLLGELVFFFIFTLAWRLAAGQAAVPLISFKTCKVLNEIRSTAFKGKKFEYQPLQRN